MIFDLTGGTGKGAALNFSVVGNPKPDNPPVNTIWVNNEVPISDWALSADEPEKADGRVWIIVGSYSQVAFNAMKENCIMVYPMSAKQCVAGAWVSITAQIRQNETWVDWFQYLYNRGDECLAVTGGWIAKSWQMAENAGMESQSYSIEKNENQLKFTKTGQIGAVMYTTYRIDLTNVKTIHFKGKMYSGESNDHWTAFYVWKNVNGRYWSYNEAASVLCEAGIITRQFSLDVSSLDPGEYYIGFGIYNASCYVELEELYMEVGV